MSGSQIICRVLIVLAFIYLVLPVINIIELSLIYCFLAC